MAKQKTTNTKENPEVLVRRWTNRLKDARDNQEKVFEEAKKNYEIYYAIMNTEERAQGWRSNVFLPILPGKARDAKAKISILEPRFQVKPADAWSFNSETGELDFDSEAVTAALKLSKKLNKEFVQFSSTGDLPPRVAMDFSTTDAIVAGWGLGFAPLKTFKKVYKTHPTLIDGDGNETVYTDQNQTLKRELLRVKTELIPLDIFKTFLSPKAKSWENPYWVIIEGEKTYAELKREAGDEGELIYDLPKGLESAKGIDTKENKFSAVRESALGFNDDGSDKKDESVDTFRVFDCYDQERNRFYTFVEAKIEGVATNWHLIRDMENPYNHGLIPIVPFYVKRRPHSPWGESFFAISRDVQYAYNAAFNQFRDNATLSTDSMLLADKSAAVEAYEVGPGRKIEYDSSLGGEKPEPFRLADPNPAVLSAQMEFLEKNAENGTTPQYNSGQVNSSMDKTAGTKGGIQMLMEAANDKLSEMYRNLKASLIRYGYISMNNAQQFQNYIEVLDSPNMTAHGLATDKAVKSAPPEFITPAEMQYAFDMDIDDESMLPLTKSERRDMFISFINMLIEFQRASGTQVEMAGTPEDLLRIDWADVSHEASHLFGELNAPAFIKKPLTPEDIKQQQIEAEATKQEAREKAAAIAQEANPDAEVSQDPNGITVQRQKRELSNFKDYPSDVKNAVLESFGYPHSQLIEDQARAELAEARGKVLDAEVKEQVVEAARKGQIEPSELAKFISK